jgi:hypothetical protein
MVPTMQQSFLMKDSKKDEGDQELIKQQKAEQTKRDDGKVKPVADDVRQPSQRS